PVKGSRAGWSPNQRNHRKILVVDGKVGYLGGINVSDVYASSPASGSGGSGGVGSGADAQRADARAAPWRDTHLRIEGPAVAQLEA
ncbi:cardiolipin synthase B, partial [Cupriavidus sp. SIMBA_020]